MKPLEGAYSARDTVLLRLEEDLLGGNLDDELTEAPLSRFIVGVLYPAAAESQHEAPDSVDQYSEEGYEKEDRSSALDGAADPGVSLSHVRHPRSMGLTFAIATDGDAAVNVSVSARRYEPANDGRWRRVQMPAWELDLDGSIECCDGRALAEGLSLRWVVRESRDGVASVTLSLVNTAEAPHGHRDDRCWGSIRRS